MIKIYVVCSMAMLILCFEIHGILHVWHIGCDQSCNDW